MERKKSLPPGFRFHPTDPELVMYYLKRKVTGRKLLSEAIADVNIYQFSPWDLPDMSALKSKDLEWFFFCPMEKKYTRGVRVKRATEKGYWKTTGKDRNVYDGDKIVGSVKTLIFHLGHAPQGERTDWVIHEYKIIDAQLAFVGLQDTYVLCKVFKKNGPGPKIGAQYGAPFNEEDWSDDDVDASEIQAADSNPNVQPPNALTPEKQSCVSLDPLVPEITSDTLLIKECPNVKQTSAITGLLHPGSTSGQSLVENSHPSAEPIASELLDQEFDDDINRFLASFTDDPLLLKNGHDEDTLIGMPQNMSVPGLNGYDIYSGLQDLNNTSAPMYQPIFDLSGLPIVDDDAFYSTFMQDSSDYIELDDLDKPLNCPTETFGIDQFYDVAGSCNHNVPQFSFNGTNQPAPCTDQPPMVSNQSNIGNSGLDVGQINRYLLGSNAPYDPFTYGQSSNGLNVNEEMFGCRR